MATPTKNSIKGYIADLSENIYLNSLVLSKWGSSIEGRDVSLTFSFMGSNSYFASSSYQLDWSEPYSPQYQSLGKSAQTATQACLTKWSNVANISFTKVADNSSICGELRFGYTAGEDYGMSDNSQAHAYMPWSDNLPCNGDVWLNADQDWEFSEGSYGYSTLLHEIGHAIGLKHPFEEDYYNSTTLSTKYDCYMYSIMSYSAYPGYTYSDVSFQPTTPMIYDILAIQYLYGENNNYNSGNTSYIYNQNSDYFETIWDGGGTDTIIWSGTTQGSIIDLNAGKQSDLGNSLEYYNYYGETIATSKYTLAIAYGTIIENATGGSSTDKIIGNQVANTLDGGAGNDSLNGGAGNDKLTGGYGSDTFVFNTALGSTNVDKIKDFNAIRDTIWLENTGIFTALTALGTLSSAAFLEGTKAGDANDRIIYNSTTGSLSYDVDGSGKKAAVQFATLTTGLALTNEDFWVI